MEAQETLKLAEIAIQCQKGIASLLAAATSENFRAKGSLHGRDIQQIQERYSQWAGNLGALQPSGSRLSLGYRLRDAPLVAGSILNTLTDLQASIQAATDITNGVRENRVADQLIDPDTDLSEYDISSSDSDTSSTPSSGSGRNPLAQTSEIEELVLAINIGLQSLFRASIFVRKFTPKDKRIRAAKTKPFDNRADVMHVKDRYPLLAGKNATLADRLGEANARRRQYFKYRRDHNERLSTVPTEGSAHDQDAMSKKQLELLNPKVAMAKSLLTADTKPSLFAETEATEFVADTLAQAQMLETHEAQSAMSVVSFATSIAESSDEELPFPPLPAEARPGFPFLCPYCLTYVDLKREGSEHQWRKHVLQDLEPYICTFPSCSLDSFQSQHAWFEHELLLHRSRWVCSQCSGSFGSSDELKEHISQRHRSVISGRQISAIVEQSKRSIDSIQPSECPFCDDPWAKDDQKTTTGEEVLVVKLDQFRRHVGHHLQQIALFALPRSTEGNENSLGSKVVGGVLDQDAMSKGLRWVRDDCGRGWGIISRRRATFIARRRALNLVRSRTIKLSFTPWRSRRTVKW
ncbi:hypothetical protein AOQ84DRAFT_429336 [Glonium stellatum]|uniref:C2H2-type domain-containing protein n=1 Tax=Glonium stellatum TaxID=574774 RepID=A0A8E2FAS5_9PEZI|nr:hypothetical protein AOQ84DRAFT_429336 [Glonium stellatum]